MGHYDQGNVRMAGRGGGVGTKAVAQIRGTIKGRGKGCEFIYEDRSRCQGCGRDG